jgi:branched-chain amino acid transport system ATP-binding protein
MTATALAVRDLRVRYGKATAVDGVSLAVEPGSMSAIVGPNGAGKSSLLLAIEGVVAAEVAAIELGGSSIAAMNATQRAKAGLVLVPQGRQIFPTLSVRDNLRVVADALGCPRDAVEDALDRFPAVRQRADHPAGVMSGGEQQMLALARALMCKPSVLLLDEPTEGLAPTIMAEVTRLLLELRAAGATIVITEPTTRVLFEHIDRGYVMMRGSLVAEASSHGELRRVFRQQFEHAGPTGLATR